MSDITNGMNRGDTSNIILYEEIHQQPRRHKKKREDSENRPSSKCEPRNEILVVESRPFKRNIIKA